MDPVYIEDGVTIERSTIGPNVTIERGTKVLDSRLANTIVGADSVLRHVQLDGAMLGEGVIADGLKGSATLGDHSEVSVTS